MSSVLLGPIFQTHLSKYGIFSQLTGATEPQIQEQNTSCNLSNLTPVWLNNYQSNLAEQAQI